MSSSFNLKVRISVFQLLCVGWHRRVICDVPNSFTGRRGTLDRQISAKLLESLTAILEVKLSKFHFCYIGQSLAYLDLTWVNSEGQGQAMHTWTQNIFKMVTCRANSTSVTKYDVACFLWISIITVDIALF